MPKSMKRNRKGGQWGESYGSSMQTGPYGSPMQGQYNESYGSQQGPVYARNGVCPPGYSKSWNPLSSECTPQRQSSSWFGGKKKGKKGKKGGQYEGMGMGEGSYGQGEGYGMGQGSYGQGEGYGMGQGSYGQGEGYGATGYGANTGYGATGYDVNSGDYELGEGVGTGNMFNSSYGGRKGCRSRTMRGGYKANSPTTGPAVYAAPYSGTTAKAHNWVGGRKRTRRTKKSRKTRKH